MFLYHVYQCNSFFPILNTLKILDAYRAGASAFKEVAAKHNLSTDNIDEIMSDVQEVGPIISECSLLFCDTTYKPNAVWQFATLIRLCIANK